MNFSKQRFSTEGIKEIDVVDYLSRLGHHPTKIRNADHWYLSPLRHEKTPSFKVNRKINRWYNHGLGKGGNIIDFGILYHGCTLAEFLQKIDTGFSFHQPVVYSSNQLEQEYKITILEDHSIRSFALPKYLGHRKIPLGIAGEFCREVRYDLNGKTYYGIGFKNDSGGYEIRNPYFKASSSPKDVTTCNNEAKEVTVFEGFTDFLSFMAIHQNKPRTATDFLVLNSVSFFEKARPFMEQHDTISLYLDNDSTGQKFTQHALSLNSKCKDESNLIVIIKISVNGS
jgi:DNA primase